MDGEDGRKSIPPARLLRALLLQMLYYGAERADADGAIGIQPLVPLVRGDSSVARGKRLFSDEHFTVDGTLIEAWAGQKSFQRKGSDQEPLNLPPPDGGSNPIVNWHKQRCKNDAHHWPIRSHDYPRRPLGRSWLGYLGRVQIETAMAWWWMFGCWPPGPPNARPTC